jgi:eukaryotic-like serine/threonine-protein kinase
MAFTLEGLHLVENYVPSSSRPEVTLDEPGQTWNELAGRVDAFVAAWESHGEETRLDSFVPAAPPALRQMVLVELIKVDLDYRWSRRQGPRLVEEYLRDFPELASAGVPTELLYEEFHIRNRCGDAVSSLDYVARFPGQAAELARMFHLGAPEHSLGLCGSSKELDGLQAGQQLDDFDLLTVLGQGSFARVFLARQRSLQRLVALKISADRGSEPQTLAQFDHPHIVRVYDQRLLPEQGLRLLYMQYLPGGDLQKVIAWLRRVPVAERTGRSLAAMLENEMRNRGEEPQAGSGFRQLLAALSWPAVVCWLGARLATALDYAHRQGVLHRDVKPANVLLTAEGLPKLADFNISCSSKLEGANPAASFGGSLAYMAPEHLEACDPSHPSGPDSLDARSDLYSLGVTLWELLTGQRPFPDEQLVAERSMTLSDFTARRRAGIDPAVVAQLPPDCPPGLAPTLLACLEPERERRIPSGRELAWELELCLQPDASRLFRPPARGWQRAICRVPVLAILLATLLPNLLAALFNFNYNRNEIIARLPEEAMTVFWNVQMAINGTAFPLGIAVIIWVAWPVSAALGRLRRGCIPDRDQLRLLRRRCLKLGHLAAVVGLVAWLLAGLAYPWSIASACASLPASACLHFMASLALCGLIAASYPFFAVTFLAVRALYPALVRAGTMDREDVVALAGLNRLLGFYLLLAALVPLLAVLTLVLIGSENRWALVVLSAGGLMGVSLVFLLFRGIQSDIAALTQAVRPAGE